MVKTLTALMLLSLAACSAITPPKPNRGFSDIQVHEVGSDPGGELCEGFSLTSDQVEQYFNRAQSISFKQLHDEYDYLPCFVKGTLLRHQQLCDFVIRAGATAELSCNDGSQYFYVCTTCEPMFTVR